MAGWMLRWGEAPNPPLLAGEGRGEALPDEADRRWAAYPHVLRGAGQHAAHGIHTEGDDAVALLVGRIEKRPCRIQREETRPFPARRFAAKQRQSSTAG